MKIKNIITLSIIGIISLLYVNEKSKNYILHRQLDHLHIEHDYYKQSTHEYLISKRNELSELKRELTEEENEWLEIYWEAKQENEEDFFVQKQLVRAKNRLSEKFGEEELAEILSRRKKITELEKQLENSPVPTISSEILNFFLSRLRKPNTISKKTLK